MSKVMSNYAVERELDYEYMTICEYHPTYGKISADRLTWVRTLCCKQCREDIEKFRTIRGYLMGIKDMAASMSDNNLYNWASELLEASENIMWHVKYHR